MQKKELKSLLINSAGTSGFVMNSRNPGSDFDFFRYNPMSNT